MAVVKLCSALPSLGMFDKEANTIARKHCSSVIRLALFFLDRLKKS